MPASALPASFRFPSSPGRGTMKTLFYQCSAGISGDMNLAALVDLGVDRSYLVDQLGRLRLESEFTLDFSRAEKSGIWGIRASVMVKPVSFARSNSPHRHGSRHAHRHYRDIRQIVVDAGYSSRVETRCLRIFHLIAEAEARVHGCEIDDVHFHEVGAIDSIVDIVGAAICLDYLAVDRVICSSVELGHGFVDCEHGTLPVPAPATAEILKGVPCRIGGVDGEATTPTGAAILKGTVDAFESPENFRIEHIGYGIGTRDFRVPNVLRVMLGELADEPASNGGDGRQSLEIKANIDDMTPEALEPLMERLFEAGAADVFLTPIVMKKSRLAHMVSVLCAPSSRDALVDALFEHSTTIGVRIQSASKRILPRTLLTLETRFGAVRVKVVELPSARSRWKVEHDDVKKLSILNGMPYGEIRKDIEAEVGTLLVAGHGAAGDQE
ncbi:nickel pincer cofactor biosynthesis protein LarC [Burkholderia sp. Bp9142]|nr:nickel pincer cofactor biosynthesis protein LarC [Burkholderia sp. Bp9142]